ncbi:MAG: CPBP family intramembrane metalloprotease [Candidatus Omnitrophica bacterium]|nr:CPBP family intramembrane metalloprotease [Candidatus Omnitrophota bacterium]
MKNKVIALIILISVFIVNDLFFIRVKTWQGFLAVDYCTRLIAIAVITCLLISRTCTFSDLGYRKMGIKSFLAWSAFLCVTGIIIDHYGWDFFIKILPDTSLFKFPRMENRFVRMFDLSIGMITVSLTEETVFRGYFFHVAKNYIKNPALLVIASAITFGVIHWSLGVDAIIMTALWSILPMLSVIKTGSIAPAIIAHYVTDLMYFVPSK